MHKHELDPVSLVCGLVLVMVAGAYGLAHTTTTRLRWEVALPAVLVVLGLAVITIVVSRMSRQTAAVADDITEIATDDAPSE